jgi:hypothetical protein
LLAAVSLIGGAFLVGRELVAAAPPIHRGPQRYVGRVGLDVSNDLFDSSTARIAAQFRQIRSGGVSWIREDLTWTVAEPHRGVFDWVPFDRLMNAASQARINVLGILDYSAPWASSDPTAEDSEFYPPKDDGDYAAYAAAVAARYGRGGTFWITHPELVPMPLTAVEIWNEPYGSWYWKPAPNPAAYAAMVRQAAPSIHAVDPEMTVLMSGDLRSWNNANRLHGRQSQPWLARLLAANPGLVKLVNGLDVHPNPEPRDTGPYGGGSTPQQSFARVPLIHQIELAAGVALPIWITEIGWSTSPDTPHAVSNQTQALYLRQAVQRSIGSWGTYVRKIFLFGWYRSSGLPRDQPGNFGLLDANGTTKPGWRAIIQLLRGRPAAAVSCAACSNTN